MNKIKFSVVIISIFVFLSVYLMGCTSYNGATATEAITPTTGSSASGEEIMQAKCSRCHNITRVTTKKKTADQWLVTVDRMLSRGVKLTADEKQTLLDYLSATYK